MFSRHAFVRTFHSVGPPVLWEAQAVGIDSSVLTVGFRTRLEEGRSCGVHIHIRHGKSAAVGWTETMGGGMGAGELSFHPSSCLPVLITLWNSVQGNGETIYQCLAKRMAKDDVWGRQRVSVCNNLCKLW